MSLNQRTAKFGAIIVTAGIVTAICSYPVLRDTFGPMTQHESQCLLCHKGRLEKWVCGEKIVDVTSSNQYSDWVDSFSPATHSHVWATHTGYYRGHWFGSTSIGCGGIAAIPRIFEQRGTVGEQNARRLLVKWHELVESPDINPTKTGKLMDDFTSRDVKDPESLLTAG